jgi:hypothetical protein
MTTGFAVWARKNSGPWLQTGIYDTKKTANTVCRAATRGEWVAEVRLANPPTVDAPMPTEGNPSAYSVMAARIKLFFPTGEFKRGKDGTDKEVMGVSFQDKVCVKCRRSGQKWEYTGHRFGWTDSRIKSGTVDMVKKTASIPHDKFPAELGRMVGEKVVVALLGLMGEPISKGEWTDMVKSF